MDTIWQQLAAAACYEDCRWIQSNCEPWDPIRWAAIEQRLPEHDNQWKTMLDETRDKEKIKEKNKGDGITDMKIRGIVDGRQWLQDYDNMSRSSTADDERVKRGQDATFGRALSFFTLMPWSGVYRKDMVAKYEAGRKDATARSMRDLGLDMGESASSDRLYFKRKPE